LGRLEQEAISMATTLLDDRMIDESTTWAESCESLGVLVAPMGAFDDSDDDDSFDDDDDEIFEDEDDDEVYDDDDFDDDDYDDDYEEDLDDEEDEDL